MRKKKGPVDDNRALFWRRRKVYLYNKGKTLLPTVFPSYRSFNNMRSTADLFDVGFSFFDIFFDMSPTDCRHLKKVFLYIAPSRIYNPVQVFLSIQNVGFLAGFVSWIQPGERSL